MPKTPSRIANGEIIDPFSSFITKSSYARWLDDKWRRETWEETVDRYVDYMTARMDRDYPGVYGRTFWKKAEAAILEHEVLPSMRALMTAGPALDSSEMAGYNCSFIAFDDTRAFDELLFILANGTGVGFSVEERHVQQLPIVAQAFRKRDDVIVVEDSRIGWATAFRDAIEGLYAGGIPRLDVSRVRPEGARLKTFGGKASGPQPFVDLIDFATRTFQAAAGRRLKPVEVHDIACKTGSVIVAGGVRRSALISLSDLGDYDMGKAKSGEWWKTSPYRNLSNNSAVYDSKPSTGQWLQEWGNLVESGSGERGIFNRESARKNPLAKRRDTDQIEGVNPCGEIFLCNMGLCNLSTIVVRPHDTLETLLDKAEIATALGTIQSTFTDFAYVRDKWRENAEEERLLGVSMTGVFDNELMNGRAGKRALKNALQELRMHVVETNKVLAGKMGINQAAAATCVKPEGSTSKATWSGSGLHAWHAPHYIQTIRVNNTNALCAFLRAAGVPNEPDVTARATTTVFSFPMKAPDGAVVKSDITAIEHLELWLMYKRHFTEHNPSVTIDVKDDEWIEVANWVYSHWDEVGGLSFMPAGDSHTYAQAPLQAVSEHEYNEAMLGFPDKLDWVDLGLYETTDETEGSQQLACVSGACEIVEVGAGHDEELAPQDDDLVDAV